MNFIRDRFPHRSEILTVLGIALFVCHSWSVLGFLDRLPAFILYFRVTEIVQVFAFMMAFAFLESLLVTGVLVFVSALLPSRWLKEGFAYKGFVLVLAVTVAAIIFQKNLEGKLPSPGILTLYWVAPLALASLIIGFVQMIPRARAILINLADRVSIMLFVYVPIGLLSLMVVALGNLL